MLYFEQNTTNAISVDAPQSAEESEAFFFFTFENQQTQDDYSTYLTRLNPSSERYGMFELVLPADIAMKAGEYTYNIYGSVNNTETDVKLLNLLEVGLASIKEEGATNVFYEPTPLEGNAYGNS